MENFNENGSLTTQKQRHGCVTAWLILMIILNSLTTISYLFASEFIAGVNYTSKTMVLLLGVLGVANVIFAVMLLKWKKLGFWGFVVSSIVVFIINLSIGIGIGQSLLGLLGVAILYGVLQIKNKGSVKTWGILK